MKLGLYLGSALRGPATTADVALALACGVIFGVMLGWAI